MIQDGARHFEDFDGLTYLNCANTGPLPKVSIQAVHEAIGLKSHPNRIQDSMMFSIPNGVREAVAPFVGARPEEILIGSGAAHGVSQAALGFPWKPGDAVVVAAGDFPSNVFNWTEAARRNGGTRILVRGRNHAATTQDFLDAITPETRIVAVSAVDFGSGEVVDLERVGAVCRERGIFFVVDGSQAVGAVPLDVKALGISLLTVAGYKWMLGPYGMGFAYLNPEWWDRIPPQIIAWTAADGVEDFNALPRDGWKWAPTARRYDGPETASFFNTAVLRRSAEFLAGFGVDAIHAHITGLLSRIEGDLPAPFRRRATPSRVPGPILSIEADDPARVRAAFTRLRENGVWVSLRDDGIRVSPHIYNTETDVERLLRLLAAS